MNKFWPRIRILSDAQMVVSAFAQPISVAELKIWKVLPLVRGFVLFHDVSLDTAAGIDWQALVGRPQPDFAGIGGSWTSCPSSPAGLTGCFGVVAEYFTHFLCVSSIEIDCIFDAVKGKRKCFACLGAVEVIF